jgi:NAD(P)-dependent dehydrogenase (short-subunit alcohol dehydrogenase family)
VNFPVHTALVVGADSEQGQALCQSLLASGCRHLVVAGDGGHLPAFLQSPSAAQVEWVCEPLETVSGVARMLELLRQRQPWQLLALLAADALPAPAGQVAGTLRQFLRRELEAPLLLAQAAQSLAPEGESACSQLWLLPPASEGQPRSASVAAALAAFAAATPASSRLLTRCLAREPAPKWDTLLRGFRAAEAAR